MKSFFILLSVFSLTLNGFSQLNEKRMEKNEGTYVYCYHKNGKISTEEFRNSSSQYMAQGYSKAFDKTGKEIYNQPTSRSGQLSSVRFTYYESGAIKSAEYNSHPDAGIQWYKKTTYFDEEGNVTGEFVLSDDMHVTYFQAPDSAYLQLEKERKAQEKKGQDDELKRQREEFVKDSSEFFIATKQQLEDGSTLEFIPDPLNGTRQQIISRSGKVIQITTEYFVKTSGIQNIRRTYYKNGRIQEEFIYEAQIWHYRKFDKRGNLIEEKLNQSITRT